MVKYLYLDPEKCTGCRSCEGMCSITNTKVLNKAKSRIHVYRTSVLSLKQFYCNQCQEHPCLDACPEDAFVIKKEQVRINANSCTGCGECLRVCDKIFILPESSELSSEGSSEVSLIPGKAIICNQCGACIPFCPENALEMRER